MGQAATARDSLPAYLTRFSLQELQSRELSSPNNLVSAWHFCRRKKSRRREARSKKLRKRSACGFWVGGKCRRILRALAAVRWRRCQRFGSFSLRHFIPRGATRNLSHVCRLLSSG